MKIIFNKDLDNQKLIRSSLAQQGFSENDLNDALKEIQKCDLSPGLNYKKINKGKYLDIGAFHPRWVSNTYLLHKKGFTGYCVDLDEDRLKWFRFVRGKKVKTINSKTFNNIDTIINYII